MVYEHFAAATNDPWKSPQLLALKDKLAAEPKNEALQKEIRQLDLKFRQKFRRRLALDKTGGWLLLGGVLVLVLAAGKAAALKKTLPLPQPKTDAGERSIKLASRARWSLAGVGLVVAGSLLIIRLANTSVLPANPAAWQKLLGKPAREARRSKRRPPWLNSRPTGRASADGTAAGCAAADQRGDQTSAVAFRHPRAGTQFADRLGRPRLYFRRHGGQARSFLLQRLQRRAALAAGD